jgi:hypothetical protein
VGSSQCRFVVFGGGSWLVMATNDKTSIELVFWTWHKVEVEGEWFTSTKS